MKLKLQLTASLLLMLLISVLSGIAQTTVSSTTLFTNNNGSGTVTFNLSNTNSFGIIITDIEGVTGTSGSVPVELYYKTTALNGSPGAISAANGWNLVSSGTITGIANTSTTVTQPFFTGLNFTIPANTTYAIAVYALGQRYHGTGTTLGATTISAGGVDFITGPNIGYGGGTPPATPSNTPRGWIGKITFVPALPCTTPPNPGNATVSNSAPCLGSSVILNLTGNSGGTGQTYEWESAGSVGGPYTSVSTASPAPNATVTVSSSGTIYYRAAVTCSSQVAYSVPVAVTVPTPFPGGTYTINSALPTGSGNFQTFQAAVAAISCGISGPVIFDVAPGSGPYNEQVSIPATVGANATNTVTFNGNGAVLTHTGSATNFVTLNLDGADYITFKNLTINGTGATNSFAVHLMNSADYNTFDSCTINASLTATGTTSAAVSMSSSITSYSTGASNGSNNVFSNCTVTGGYFGFVFYGGGPAGNTANAIINCVVKEYYVYGSYNLQQGGTIISNNTFERPTRASVSTGYGVLLTTGCINMLVEGNRIRKLWHATPTSTGTTYCLYNAAAASPGNENKFYNNLVSDIHFNGTIYGVYNVGGTYVQIYHNTISLDQTGATGTTTTYGIYNSGTAGVDIRNNIVSISRGGTGVKHCLYYTPTTTGSNNNDLYMNAAAGTNNVGSLGTTGYTTLAAWQAANSSAWDQQSQAADPIFASPATGDYTPTNSVIDNMGAPLGVANDINGLSRSVTTPDVGAVEFSVPLCTGSPIAGTASVAGNITSACLGGPIALSLSGFSIGNGISIQWQESPAGAGAWMAIPGATTSSVSTILGGATDYRATITCANGGGIDFSNVITIATNPMYLCYCSPLTGITLHSTTANYITNVTILNTPLNCSTTNASGYTQLSHLIPANTATLTQGQTYTLNATIASASYNTELWIDWDQNGTFDASEYTLLTPGTTATASFSVPVTAVPGLTGMRLRNVASTTLHGAAGACANITVGRETEDYVITIAPGVPCSGTPSTAGTVSSSSGSVCNGESVTLSITGFPTELDIAYQWESSPAGQSSYSPITGATAFSHTSGALSASTDFRMAVTCTNAGGGTAYSNVVSVTVNNPQITSTTPATRCGVGTVTLGATASVGNNVNWYANPTGGSPLAANTGSFTTPPIAATTTYYAAANAGGVTGNVGMVYTGAGTAGAGQGTYGLVFDAISAFKINTVTMYPNAASNGVAGTVTIGLYNHTTNTLLQTVTVNCTGYVQASNPTPQTVTVNMQVPQGTNYRLAPVSWTGLATLFFHNSTSTPLPVYPYTVPGVVSITAGTFGGTLYNNIYYYFYDWTVSSGCEGTRVPVLATVTPPPAYSITVSPDTVCQGGSSAVSVSSANAYTYTWTPGGNVSSFSVSPTATTTYYLSGVDGNNCGISDSAIVNVKSVPASVATLASQPAICVSGPVTLSLNPVPMYGIGIQWQKDSGSGFADISGANGTTLVEAITGNVSYQAKLFCNSTLVTTSTPVAVTYNNPQILNTFPGARCGTGPVTVLALPAPGVTVKWYANQTGGASLGSGNAYTSPSISSTTTYYAEPTSGLGGLDSLAVPIANGTTSGVYYHMFMVSSPTGMTINNIGIKCLNAVGTLTSWEIYYRPDNYQLVPGANLSSTGWTLLSTVTNVPSLGSTTYTTISTNLALVIPPGATYSFHIAPVGGAQHQYATNAMGTITATNSNASIIAGHRGSALFNCNTTAGQPVVKINYSLGCVGPRVPVDAIINGSPSGTGLSTGGTTLAVAQPDGTTISYTDACNDTVTVVTDASGGNVLGNTFATVLTSASVQTHGVSPYVPRVFDITPTSSGAATVTLYVLQSEFNAYNSYVTSNSLPLPLLPTGPSDLSGISNIVVTQYHGQPSAGTTGPGGLYNNANVTLIPNSAITKWSNGSFWKLSFAVSGFSGFFIHTGTAPLSLDLRYISATNAGSRNRIDWATASELTGDGFELERSTDGDNFVKIASIQARGHASDYTYWDEQPATGVNYYRLRMIDVSGSISYSKIVSAVVKTGGLNVEVYPNPVRDLLTVKVKGSISSEAVLTISDITGKVLRTVPVDASRMEIDMKAWAQGMYLIRFTDGTYSQTIKLDKL